MRDDREKVWMAQWQSAAVELETVRAQELRGMSERASADLFNRCAMPAGDYWISPQRAAASGLVEQQRLFKMSRANASRS